jgi:formylglycine-generating enzyme required for sulfatase activity
MTYLRALLVIVVMIVWQVDPRMPVNTNSDWSVVSQQFNQIEMVLVPPGCFIMGEGSASHEVCITQPFWLDRLEVSISQFNQTSPNAQLPRAAISWTEAASHCSSRGGRLPSEAEWEYAARGPDSIMYPWGDNFEVEDAQRYVSPFNSNNVVQPGGQHPDGASWVGAENMVGNLREWTNSIYRDYPYDADDGRENSTAADNRVVRGATSFSNAAPPSVTTRSGTIAPNASLEDIGFRCVRPYRDESFVPRLTVPAAPTPMPTVEPMLPPIITPLSPTIPLPEPTQPTPTWTPKPSPTPF